MARWIRNVRSLLACLVVAALFSGQAAALAVADENQTGWDTVVLKSAMAASRSSMRIGEFEWGSRLRISQAIYFLALAAYEDPDLTAGGDKTVAERLSEHLQYLCIAGNEPTCRGGLGGWVDNPVAQALAFARNSPAVWSLLTAEQQQRLDFIMQVMAVVGNYTQNYENNPVADLSQDYAWSKMWGPNMEDGYVGVMVAAYYYFGGAENVNRILSQFSYDEYIATMERYGFEQMKEFFQKTGKTLLEEGGEDTNKNGQTGWVCGARIPFTYQDVQTKQRVAYQPFALFCSRARAQFCHTVSSVVYDGVGRIADGSVSPYEGLAGMSYEFMARDSGGYRTDAHYIQLGLRNTIPIRATIQAFGDWPDSVQARQIESLMQVGVEDYLFKVDPKHGGYLGFSMGKEKRYSENDFQGEGHMYFKEIWKKVLQRESGFIAVLQREVPCVQIQGYHLSTHQQLEMSAAALLYENKKLVGIETRQFQLPPLSQMGEVGRIPLENLSERTNSVLVLLFDSAQGTRQLEAPVELMEKER